ncbi:MAG: DUF3313 family protein [Phycisphaerales bacterium]|jgi:hypothetical protein
MRSTTRAIFTAFLPAALLAISLTGCRGSTEVPRMGFVPDSIRLKPMSGDKLTRTWAARSIKPLSSYSSVQVEAVEVPAYADIDCTDEQLQTIRTTLQNDLQNYLGNGGGTGPVLVVRAAITAVKPNNPLLNVAPQTQMMKRGYGYGAVEIYATAGLGGPVVAAMASTVDTQRFSAEKLEEMGTVERGCQQWSQAFAGLFD